MNLDIIIFVSFLLVNIALGLYSSSGIKNIREYAVGSRNFSTATIAATIVATWIGGSSFAITTSEVYNQGLYFIIPGFADSLSFFLIAYFIAPRVGEFLGYLSVADAMGNLYGHKVRAISAISAIFPAISNVAIQFTVLTSILSYFLEISAIYATLVSSGIVIVYSSLGGIKAVTFTDIIQFFTFGVIMPIIALLMWKAIGTDNLVDTLSNNPLFDYKEVLDYKNPKFLNALLLFFFFIIPGLDPALFQRITLARDTKQVANSFYIAGLFIVICDAVVLTIIGILLIAANKGNLSLNQDNMVAYIASNYLSIGFKGLFLVGITAMIMSTADSYINSASILITNDLLKSFKITKTEQSELTLVRIIACLVGVSALLLCWMFQNLLELILISYSFYMPIVSVPLLLAIFGFRSQDKAVLLGMLAGFLTVIYFKMFTQIDSLVPGMLANMMVFITSHYLLGLKGGWIGIKDQASLNITLELRKNNFSKSVRNIKNFNFFTFCRSNLPQHQSMFVCYGFFCLISIFAAVYSTPHDIYNSFSASISWLYGSVLVVSTIFITYPIWSAKFKNELFIAVLWNFSVIYNLVFVSSLMVLINKFANIHLVVLMSNLITVGVLLRFSAAIMLMPIGVILSSGFYKMLAGSLPLSSNDYQYKIIYSLLFIAAILIAFLKPKQDRALLVEEKAEHLAGRIGYKEAELQKALLLKDEFIRNVTHEYHAPMTGVISTAESLLAAYDFLDDQGKKNAIENIYKSAVRLESFDANISNLAKLSNMEAELSMEQINLGELVLARLHICQKLYIENALQTNYQFIIDIEDNVMARCDQYYLSQTLDNLIINALIYCKKGNITLELKREKYWLKFSIKDQGIGIPKDELIKIFEPFTVSSKTRTPAGGRGVGLALCKKVIEMHQGEIYANSSGVETIFSFKIPA